MEKQDKTKNDKRNDEKSPSENERPAPDPVKLEKDRIIYEEREEKPKE
jgi:hypothetical protein